MRRAMPCCVPREVLRSALLAVALLGGFAACSKPDPEESTRPSLIAVTRGPMRVTVTEGGSLASAKPVRVVNEMEGRAMILWLVKEGAVVNVGDVVCKLDSAEVRDNLNREQAATETEAASLRQAAEKHAIQLSQNESDVRNAELKCEFARVDYEKYVQGDYPQSRKKLEAELTIAEEEYKRATNKLNWSRRLEEKKFITRTELEADELAAKKGEIEVSLAQNALKVLADFEWPKQSKKLEAERNETAKELERVRRRGAAEAAKTESDMNVKQRTHALALEKLERTKSQLEKSVIRAPVSGLVVYARQDRGRMGTTEPISEGKQLHEREEIMQIPDAKRMVVQGDIHESMVKKVHEGQPASVRLDAIPGRVFTGVVTSLSSVPSTSNSWMNPDLKVYPAEIEIREELEDFKPGMNAQVEILVADVPSALQVPMQAIHQTGGRTFAYVDRNGAPTLAPVEVGLNNDRNVIVTSGLEEGERVYLAVPPGAPALPEGDGPGPANRQGQDGAGAAVTAVPEPGKTAPPAKDSGPGAGDKNKPGRHGAGSGGDARPNAQRAATPGSAGKATKDA